MIDRLYNLPESAMLFITIAVIVSLMAGLPFVVRRIPWMTPSDLNTDFVVRTQATLFTMTSLVLTFTLVQADINYRQADSLVTNEASRIDMKTRRRLLPRFRAASSRSIPRPSARTWCWRRCSRRSTRWRTYGPSASTS
jgi:hypothetical protein